MLYFSSGAVKLGLILRRKAEVCYTTMIKDFPEI